MFQIAKATVAGAVHARVGRNNQDAVVVRQSEDLLVAVVADGCSSGAGGASRNEVGAQLGAEVTGTLLWEYAQEAERCGSELCLGGVHADLTHFMQCVVGSLALGDYFSEDFRQTVFDMFLFTLVVTVVTPKRATFAVIGDGEVYVNGKRFALGPFPNNEPPYIGYALTKSRADTQFKVLADLPTEELQHFLIGSDGVADLAGARDERLPSGRPVGPIEQLWTDDRFFGTWRDGQFVENPDLLRRHLALVNGGLDRRHPAHLKDDTTLVVGRRVPK